ncbi:hypothetical protein PDG61_17095 [Mycolicibacterium sp. BiH015]|uniref:hypothetical protein n=1 Tax=Mycolicibacterium sp. BiH015 TaxID=3018808 RepID=UPI0022E82AC4|nr:hypothetical protein [Mycolicibacterium sp. BiH015]MDA2892640.1 hypothetical protein [Mycolicibacterium sp. BiH015]
MVSDADVTNNDSGPLAVGDSSAASPPQATPAATCTRSWSPISRNQVDEVRRTMARAVAGVGTALAVVARHGARSATAMWRGIDAVPVALRKLYVLAVLMLLGIVGSLAASGTAGLVCAIVVVPVSSVAAGAVGHRWFTRNSAERPAVQADSAELSELQRSMGYVDTKLALALNSFGTERHQQAVIALFQAKTAVELALGTEQSMAGHIDEPVSLDDYGLRPRIRPGQHSNSLTPESTSRAAS